LQRRRSDNEAQFQSLNLAVRVLLLENFRLINPKGRHCERYHTLLVQIFWREMIVFKSGNSRRSSGSGVLIIVDQSLPEGRPPEITKDDDYKIVR
jgi:hypothetical protein